MEIFFLGLHDTETFPYIMEKFLTDLHDILFLLYIMENLLADFHGMERFPYTMEIFFISCLRKNAPAVMLTYLKDRTAPCYRPEQFYHQICRFLLLVKYKSSSTPSPFSLFYCSNSPLRAVVIR